MSNTTLSKLSKQDLTAAYIWHGLALHRAGLLDFAYARDLISEEYPGKLEAIEKRRARRPKRRLTASKKRHPQYKADDLLTPDQAAKVLGLSPKTLANFRSAGGGPLFIKLANRTIRYRHSELETYISNATKQNTSQYGERT